MPIIISSSSISRQPFKWCIVILFVGIGYCGYAQKDSKTLIVDYDIVLNDTTAMDSAHWAYYNRLITNGYKSYQVNLSHMDTVLYNKNGGAHRLHEKPINIDSYFKDIKNKEVVCKRFIKFKKPIMVRDTLDLNYIIGSPEKEILGYQCKQLLVSFRGRDYEVYYTTELANYKDGPWKFTGAPGLILEVKSFDNAVTMMATCVQQSDQYEMKNIPDKWLKLPVKSYPEYVIEKYNGFEEIKAKFLAEDPRGGISIPYRFFEIHTPYFAHNHR